MKLGTRSPENLQQWVDQTEGTVSAGSFADAATHGDVVVLAVLGAAAEDVIYFLVTQTFSGKVVFDATNPLDFSEGMPPYLLFGGTDSLGEWIQAQLSEASIVKCFNPVSNAQMVDPEFEEGTPPMLICGNDVEAKEWAEDVLIELGWPGTLDVGDITSARYLEALVPLWVRAGAVLDTWMHAFKVVK